MYERRRREDRRKDEKFLCRRRDNNGRTIERSHYAKTVDRKYVRNSWKRTKRAFINKTLHSFWRWPCRTFNATAVVMPGESLKLSARLYIRTRPPCRSPRRLLCVRVFYLFSLTFGLTKYNALFRIVSNVPRWRSELRTRNRSVLYTRFYSYYTNSFFRHTAGYNIIENTNRTVLLAFRYYSNESRLIIIAQN